MLYWDKLLNSKRRKDKDKSKKRNTKTASGRLELERDFDRILFAAPTRRMADKTQVFPLDKNDSVRTRLTHSYEVSNFARGLGVKLAFECPEKVFGKDHERLQVKRVVPPFLAALALAHDMGNPPFGHQGEVAIQNWFKKNKKDVFKEEDILDFESFDGNAQTIRLVTRLQILNDDYGLNLTYATLAAMFKYPTFWSEKESVYKKAGIFQSEREIALDVWKETGLQQGVRHPFTYIVEACDDIAYSVLDAEDTVKKGYASYYDLIDSLKHFGSGDEVVNSVIKKSEGLNRGFKKEKLSSRELNDISMQMFRVFAISNMVEAVFQSFINNLDEIMSGQVSGLELIKKSKASSLCKGLKSFDLEYGYKNKEVLRLELEGNNYIASTMDMLWAAISDDGDPLYNKYAMSRVSENYKRVYELSQVRTSSYKKAQLMCDIVSGMTDSFLIHFHDDLKPLYDGFSGRK